MDNPSPFLFETQSKAQSELCYSKKGVARLVARKKRRAKAQSKLCYSKKGEKLYY